MPEHVEAVPANDGASQRRVGQIMCPALEPRLQPLRKWYCGKCGASLAKSHTDGTYLFVCTIRLVSCLGV